MAEIALPGHLSLIHKLKKGGPLQEFAPATTWIPNGIPMENQNWNSHGRRSKHFDSAQCSAPATAQH